MPKPTRAEVLAEYLGLTPETHPECFECCGDCKGLHDCSMSGAEARYKACLSKCLSLPNPLTPGHEADAWLGVLVRTKDFWTIHAFTDGFGSNVFREGWRSPFGGEAPDPTPAIVRAMMAADSTFAAKMEGAEG